MTGRELDAGRPGASSLLDVGSVRAYGELCFWAGMLGAASGVLLALIPPAVEDDRYSYPLGTTAFVAIQLWFVVQHLGLLAGIVAIGRARLAGDRRLGLRLAVAGMILLTLTEAFAITAAGSTYPGPGTDVLDGLYGTATIAIGLGLTTAGVAVVRARLWAGWRRWIPLALGVYVFVPMLPALFAGFLGARLAITGWMLLFATLGWALSRGQGA